MQIKLKDYTHLQKVTNFTAAHCTHITFSHDFEEHNHYSQNFEHAYLDINIKKTHFIPTLYQQTYPTYNSIGASDRDMQWGTTLVFEMNILNLKGSVVKGTKI